MHRIYRVHKHLRDVNEKAYEPEIIAIGPYHSGKESLQMMEEHKKRYLDLLLERNKQTYETYASVVGELEKDARDCYAEPISLSSDELIAMLVRDGCFIIELLRKFDDRGATQHDDPIFQMEWMMNSLHRDLLLFENQIPFIVLCLLFDLIEEPGQHERLIELVLKFWENICPGGVPRRSIDDGKRKYHDISYNKGKYHLLNLVHQFYRPPLAAAHICLEIDGNDIVKSKQDGDGDDTMKEKPLIIHSATELKKANVKFRAKTDSTLFEVDFKEGGIMQMPPLTIEDRTECFFRNLIVYEHYTPDGQPNYVTDYVRILNCLIDSPADVEILSQRGIVNNLLGDDKAVARFINRLTETISRPGTNFVYADTFKMVNAYYEKRWNRACAALKRDYCYSPWATLAVVVASVVLTLTITQTVCSILQVRSNPQSFRRL